MGQGITWGFGIDLYTLLHLKYSLKGLPAKTSVRQRELCSIFCNSLNGKRIRKGIDIHMCIAESLCSTPEINRTLLIKHTPI